MSPGPLPFLASLRVDIRAHIPPEARAGPRSAGVRKALAVAVGSSGFHLTFLYRAAHTLRSRFGFPGRVAAWAFAGAIRHGFGCSIAPTARLEGGLILPHPWGS